jgi:NTE family protein
MSGNRSSVAATEAALEFSGEVTSREAGETRRELCGETMEAPRGRKRVAIACQGGGSHTAFTAGVLKRLFQPEELARYEVVGLSGTSGGAVCALLAWYALLGNDPTRAGSLLEEFWADNAATAPADKMLNSWMMWASRMADYVVTPAVSPYHTPVSVVALDEFRRALQRRVDFDRIQINPDGAQPMLLVGAVDVLSGEFKAFNSRHERITVDVILASAAIPNLFRAVRLDGGVYWDGLFSQNPPVRELIDAEPEEIWVIQINAKEWETEPTTMIEIADRRNELAGNLSLHQELHVIEKIDQLLEEGLLARSGKYRPIVVRVIEMPPSRLSRSLGTFSKLNRDPSFIQDLIVHGESQAEEFLTSLAFEDAWRSQDPDAVLAFFDDDVELASSAPFVPHGPSRGQEAVRRFVLEHLHEGVRVDLTRKQVARSRVAWTVRTRGDSREERVRGRAEAQFRDGKVISFRLGPETQDTNAGARSGS